MRLKNEPGMAARLALRAIRAYQRHLSPHKGFVCSYRVHTGRDSCSAYGCRVIARHGLRRGLVLLLRRLDDCGHQHHLHAPKRPALSPLLRRQAGVCDVPSCDLPSCDSPGCNLLGDLLEVVDTARICRDSCRACNWRRNDDPVGRAVRNRRNRERRQDTGGT